MSRPLWVTPTPYAPGGLVTANTWNALTNDASFLGGSASAVNTAYATMTQTVYNQPSGGGESPSVTVVTGSAALVILSVRAYTSTTSDILYTSFKVEGDSFETASDAYSLLISASNEITVSYCMVQQSLTPGESTFSMLHRVSSGTGYIYNRSITVVPLP